MKSSRASRRTAAEERNSRTQFDKRRSFWRQRGFERQSHAARLIATTVAEINQQAIAHKQRAEDWPLLPEWME